MKVKLNIGLSRVSSLSVALFLLCALALPLVSTETASASQLTSRKLTLSSSANGTISTDLAGNAVAAGSGGNGTKAKHTFNFTIPTTGNVGSILIQYCTSPIPVANTCDAAGSEIPTGINTDTIDSATGFPTQSGFSSNNFTVDTTTASPSGECDSTGTAGSRKNCIMIKRASTASETNGATISLGFGGTSGEYITNPTADNSTFFVRISTYSDTGYTTLVDKGSVASSTAQQIDITAKVQEKLNFSVGKTVTAPSTTCAAFSDNGALALGDSNGVLDSGTQYDAHSYFRISTNSVNGAKVYYSGDTLKDGANDINALTSETATNAGSETFGLALDSADTQAGSGYSFTDLSPNAGYNEGNGTIPSSGNTTTKFNYTTTAMTTPVEIASSTGIVTCDTGSVRYIGNIATNTPAGIYTTTITYIAVPTF